MFRPTNNNSSYYSYSEYYVMGATHEYEYSLMIYDYS